MTKYVLLAILVLFTASCAAPRGDVGGREYRYLESRKKSETAEERVAIGKTGAAFYYDRRQWSVESADRSKIDFTARRFTNAHIFSYDERIPMTDIYRKLVEHYKLRNPQLLESEFVKVNGAEVIFNKLEGTMNRRQVVFMSYGYSGGKHTVIVHGYIYKSMLRAETESEIVEFLNGFVNKG